MAGKKVTKKTKAVLKSGKTTKRTVGNKVEMIKIPKPLRSALSAKAAADTNFKGANFGRYALHILKNFVAKG